jgi:hypothetical protein
MTASPLRPGSVVIAYNQNPRERFWGVLRALDPTGIVMEGIDLSSFDDWVRQSAEGREGLSLSTVFIPLHRVEKLLLDDDTGAAPSLSLQFEKRVGRTLQDFIDREKG